MKASLARIDFATALNMYMDMYMRLYDHLRLAHGLLADSIQVRGHVFVSGPCRQTLPFSIISSMQTLTNRELARENAQERCSETIAKLPACLGHALLEAVRENPRFQDELLALADEIKDSRHLGREAQAKLNEAMLSKPEMLLGKLGYGHVRFSPRPSSQCLTVVVSGAATESRLQQFCCALALALLTPWRTR